MSLVHAVRLGLVFALIFARITNAQTPTPSPVAPTLSPIAFLTAHEWEAQLPVGPDGKARKIHAQFTWAKNGQAIRISNQMITDGKSSPYIEGIYAVDQQAHTIAFWYVGADGGMSKGTVKPENGQLVHEFEETRPDGKTTQYTARVTPNGDKGWENEISVRGPNGELTTMVKVKYEVAKK